MTILEKTLLRLSPIDQLVIRRLTFIFLFDVQLSLANTPYSLISLLWLNDGLPSNHIFIPPSSSKKNSLRRA